MTTTTVQPSLQHRLEQLLTRPLGGRRLQVVPGVALGTTKGPVREENQDRAAAAYVRVGGRNPREFLLIALADGMGGMRDGGIAATLALSHFVAGAVESERATLRSALEEATWRANDAVFASYHGSGGATLTALVCTMSGTSQGVHVGDTRLYKYSPHAQLDLITTDDTISGVMGSPDKDSEHDNRLLQFIGVGSELRPHLLDTGPASGATWAITSDGAHTIGKRLLARVLYNSVDPGDVARRLMTVADALGSPDNATVVSLDFDQFAPPPTLSGGTAIVVWTPSDRVEMWLPDAGSSAVGTLTRREPASSPQAPAEEREGRPTRAGKTRKGKSQPPRRKPATPPAAGPEVQEVVPQLIISFDPSTSEK